jgi:hypothetical protein
MRLIFILATLLLISSASFSQTKRIAHRSHSGSDATFSWEQSPDNFGETPEMKRRSDSLQKQRLIADSVRRKVVSDSLERIKKTKVKKKKN